MWVAARRALLGRSDLLRLGQLGGGWPVNLTGILDVPSTLRLAKVPPRPHPGFTARLWERGSLRDFVSQQVPATKRRVAPVRRGDAAYQLKIARRQRTVACRGGGSPRPQGTASSTHNNNDNTLSSTTAGSRSVLSRDREGSRRMCAHAHLRVTGTFLTRRGGQPVESTAPHLAQ